MANKHWCCPECGRSTLQQKYQPHKCRGVFKARGWQGRLEALPKDRVNLVIAQAARWGMAVVLLGEAVEKD